MRKSLHFKQRLILPGGGVLFYSGDVNDMISKTQIKYMSGAASYARGLDIYLDGKVLDMDVQDFGSYDEVVASVKGSGRNIYEVDVSVDKEDNQIDNIYCECPAYGEYDGICKHCVAVLLEYNEYAARQQVDPQKLNQLKGVKRVSPCTLHLNLHSFCRSRQLRNLFRLSREAPMER